MTVHTIYAEPPETFDYADWNRRVIAVAERHRDTASPEFAQWLDGRLDPSEIAALVAALYSEDRIATRMAFQPYVDEWIDHVASGPRELRSELRREP